VRSIILICSPPFSEPSLDSFDPFNFLNFNTSSSGGPIPKIHRVTVLQGLAPVLPVIQRGREATLNVSEPIRVEEAQMRVRQKGELFSSAVVIALLLVTAGTLIAQDVRYNFMPRTDFSKYRTYKWVNIGGAHPDQINGHGNQAVCGLTTGV
jgi:hypothetical protein